MHAQIDLPPRPSSAGAARRWLRTSLAAWGLAGLEDDALLLTSELVTNALLHARTPITVQLRATGNRIRIEVCDQSPVPPALRSFSPESGTGRGLLLVSDLSHAWGFDLVGESGSDGKGVWFELVVPDVEARAEAGPVEGTGL